MVSPEFPEFSPLSGSVIFVRRLALSYVFKLCVPATPAN
jgi:hypothetical protein